MGEHPRFILPGLFVSRTNSIAALLETELLLEERENMHRMRAEKNRYHARQDEAKWARVGTKKGEGRGQKAGGLRNAKK